MSPDWTRLAEHTGGTIAALTSAAAKTGETLVFAATPVGVYRSADAGRTWSLPGLSPTVPLADALALSPRFAQDRTIFACGADGLYRSTDAGDTWQQVLVGSRILTAVSSQSDRPSGVIVLAGTETDGILVSEDSGHTWTGANAGLLDLTALSLAVSPCFERDKTGFAGTTSGLYRTRNGGRSWRSVETGIGEPAVQCLAVSPNFADDHLVLAGTESDGLLRSTDGGTSWHRPPALADGGIAALAFAPSAVSNPARQAIAAATSDGIALSTDDGETWHILEDAPREPVLSLLFLEDVLLAGLHRRGLVRSASDGLRWAPSSEGLSARLDTELVLSPDFARDRTVFAAGLEVEEGVRVSSDAGLTWEVRTTGLQDATVYGFAVSDTGTTLYAATSAGIRVSRDGTRTWRECSAAEGSARAVATGPGVVLYALEGGRLQLSEDSGQTWRALPGRLDAGNIVALAISPSYARDRTFFVATATPTQVTLWRSTDNGERWERWLVEPVSGGSRLPVALPPTYGSDGSMFVGLAGRVLKPVRHAHQVRTGERRPLWHPTGLGPQTIGITALATSPGYAEDRTLFAATNAGVFVSRDRGDSFQRWAAGLVPQRMVSIAVSPTYQVDRLVYGLGLGGTVWRRRAE